MKQQDRHSKRKGSLAISALVLAFVGGLAQAAPVALWGYSTNATFSAPTFTAGNPLTSGTPSELSWGAAGGNFQAPTANPLTNRSALTVGNFAAGPPETLTGGGPATGTVVTDTNGILTAPEIGRGISFTHWNNILDSGFATLTGATITDTLTLNPTTPPPPNTVSGPTLSFVFKFRETPNGGGDGGAGLCADGSTAASHVGGCPDLFGFNNLSVINNQFTYLGDTYFASVLTLNPNGTINFLGIPTLSNAECGILGLANGCLGFRTDETLATTVRFGLAVSLVSLNVPEPGSLALFGLALAGIGLSRRRKAPLVI